METKETKLEKEPKKNLMNFKKQELIDIILRKDDVERGLKTDIMGMESKQRKTDRELKECEKFNDFLKSELAKANKKVNIELENLQNAKNKINFYKKEHKRMQIIVIVSLIVALIGIAVGVVC